MRFRLPLSCGQHSLRCRGREHGGVKQLSTRFTLSYRRRCRRRVQRHEQILHTLTPRICFQSYTIARWCFRRKRCLRRSLKRRRRTRRRGYVLLASARRGGRGWRFLTRRWRSVTWQHDGCFFFNPVQTLTKSLSRRSRFHADVYRTIHIALVPTSFSLPSRILQSLSLSRWNLNLFTLSLPQSNLNLSSLSLCV